MVSKFNFKEISNKIEDENFGFEDYDENKNPEDYLDLSNILRNADDSKFDDFDKSGVGNANFGNFSKDIIWNVSCIKKK